MSTANGLGNSSISTVAILLHSFHFPWLGCVTSYSDAVFRLSDEASIILFRNICSQLVHEWLNLRSISVILRQWDGCPCASFAFHPTLSFATATLRIAICKSSCIAQMSWSTDDLLFTIICNGNRGDCLPCSSL